MVEKELPLISIEKRKLSPNGIIIESEYFQVKGEKLKDCEATINRLRVKNE